MQRTVHNDNYCSSLSGLAEGWYCLASWLLMAKRDTFRRDSVVLLT